MLDTQYRMHPELSQYPSSAFYGGALKDGPNVIDINRTPDWQRRSQAFRMPYAVHQLASQEIRIPGGSIVNPIEVAFGTCLLKELAFALDASSDQEISVGCVAGYAGQVHLIAKSLRRSLSLSGDSDISLCNTSYITRPRESV